MPVVSDTGTQSGPEAERETLAAEYVLGTLGAHEAAMVVQAMATDMALAVAVADWDRLLAPLTSLAPPEAPPADLWGRIERRIAPEPGTAIVPRTAAAPRVRWRTRLLAGWAIGATAVAAVGAFAVFNGWVGRETQPVMTVLLADRTQTAWSAAVDRNGALRLATVPPANGTPETPTPEDRVLQLWALPPGATKPTSLGILPRGQSSVTVPVPTVKPVPGMLIEITLEPPGGSPLERPSGPVLFIGRLSQPGPDS